MIHMECQALFSLKKNNKVLSVVVVISGLTITPLWVIFPQKIGFDFSCKLSPEAKMRSISKCLLQVLPSMLSIRVNCNLHLQLQLQLLVFIMKVVWY